MMIDKLDEELIIALSKMGVSLIMFGVECANPRFQKLRSNEKIEKAKHLVEIMNRNGIKSYAFYLIGFPEESEEDFYKTLMLGKYINSTYAKFNVLAPYPGSPLWSLYVKDINDNGLIFKFNSNDTLNINKNFNLEQLNNFAQHLLNEYKK